jgi:hypothetical protein
LISAIGASSGYPAAIFLVADRDFRRRQNGLGVTVLGAQRADAHLSGAHRLHLLAIA